MRTRARSHTFNHTHARAVAFVVFAAVHERSLFLCLLCHYFSFNLQEKQSLPLNRIDRMCAKRAKRRRIDTRSVTAAAARRRCVKMSASQAGRRRRRRRRRRPRAGGGASTRQCGAASRATVVIRRAGESWRAACDEEEEIGDQASRVVAASPRAVPSWRPMSDDDARGDARMHATKHDAGGQGGKGRPSRQAGRQRKRGRGMIVV